MRERRLARRRRRAEPPAPSARCSANTAARSREPPCRAQPTGSCGSAELEVGSATGAGVRTGGPLDISFVLESDEEYRAWIYLGISEGAATPIFLINPGREAPVKPGKTRISVHDRAHAAAPRALLPLGRGLSRLDERPGAPRLATARAFDVYGPELDAVPRAIVRLSPVHVDSTWSFEPAAGA